MNEWFECICTVMPKNVSNAHVMPKMTFTSFVDAFIQYDLSWIQGIGYILLVLVILLVQDMDFHHTDLKAELISRAT